MRHITEAHFLPGSFVGSDSWPRYSAYGGVGLFLIESENVVHELSVAPVWVPGGERSTEAYFYQQCISQR